MQTLDSFSPAFSPFCIYFCSDKRVLHGPQPEQQGHGWGPMRWSPSGPNFHLTTISNGEQVMNISHCHSNITSWLLEKIYRDNFELYPKGNQSLLSKIFINNFVELSRVMLRLWVSSSKRYIKVLSVCEVSYKNKKDYYQLAFSRGRGETFVPLN